MSRVCGLCVKIPEMPEGGNGCERAGMGVVVWEWAGMGGNGCEWAGRAGMLWYWAKRGEMV